MFPQTMYADIKSSLKSPPESDSFPDVMSAYEREFGRVRLVEKIWERFDYTKSFPQLLGAATRFHRELATMPYIVDIITTNWDAFFEEECGAIPMVTGDDYALINFKGRKVYKIHGSINVISSLVATREDYNECLESLKGSALGGTLRHFIATRPVVFIGYSMLDPDFQDIYTALTKDLGKMNPKNYFVSPFPSEEAKRFGMKEIVTDGTFFLHKMKEKIVEHGCHLPDSVYHRAEDFFEKSLSARRAIRDINHTDLPGVLYGHFYLDGVLDATGRIRARRATGEYSDRHHVAELCRNYEKLLGNAIDRGRYDDAAYIEGYVSTLITLLLDDDDPDVPPYFCFTQRSIHDLEDFVRAARNLRRRNRSAFDKAVKISRDAGPDLIPMHTPFLDGVFD
ncbi:hypothetical protein CU254_09580 [Amycolatopsis sp. AA4]|nr:hypothetical protein CU254_09580 [Amycolatopsis sp. AA4]